MKIMADLVVTAANAIEDHTEIPAGKLLECIIDFDEEKETITFSDVDEIIILVIPY